MIDIALIKPSRIGIWLCFGLYLTAFALPAKLEEAYVPGVSLFLLGAVAFVLSLYGVVYCIFQDFVSWNNFHFMVASVPWLANLFVWFGFALYAQGHGRAALRAGLICVFLAAVVLITNPGGISNHYRPTTQNVLTQLSSPAYLAWAGSMGLLVILAAHLAWRQNRAASLWRPTPEWLAGIEGSTFDDVARRSGHVPSNAIVADTPTGTESSSHI